MPGAPWKPWLLQPHGTMAAGRRHYRDDAERRDGWARRHAPNVIPLPERP